MQWSLSSLFSFPVSLASPSGKPFISLPECCRHCSGQFLALLFYRVKVFINLEQPPVTGTSSYPQTLLAYEVSFYCYGASCITKAILVASRLASAYGSMGVNTSSKPHRVSAATQQVTWGLLCNLTDTKDIGGFFFFFAAAFNPPNRSWQKLFRTSLPLFVLGSQSGQAEGRIHSPGAVLSSRDPLPGPRAAFLLSSWLLPSPQS